MTLYTFLPLILLVFLLFLFIPLLAKYIVSVFQGSSYPILTWLEKKCYQLGGVNESEEMTWRKYLNSLLLFNFFGFIFLFLLLLIQGYLPLNPQHFSALSKDLAFNISISFVTNTNWQSYAGETTLSYLSQMLGLTAQNFLSASTGISALLVLIRGLSRDTSLTVGNFWQDLTRTIVYIFIPLSILLAIFLLTQGAIQTFSPYIQATTLENETQIIPLGPVASQVAIKLLGTNGGGFFNANSAHPFENPTPASNFFGILSLLLIPASLVGAYGKMLGSPKEGWMLLGVMSFLLMLSLVSALMAEYFLLSPYYPEGSWEGIETRIGPFNSILWTVFTTGSANGSVNAMLSSLSPIAGGIALWNIKIGEILFGGVGVGLTGMIMFVFLTVFLSGLMVGKTPEYLGKKIEKNEMQWVMAAIMIPGLLVLGGVTWSIMLNQELIENMGPHGLTEILYAFSSTAAGNGSSFSSLNASSREYNIVFGFIMLAGRLAAIIPPIAIGGLLAKKKAVPPSKGTLATASLIFSFMLIGTILIVGGLTYFPALAVGPILEHFLMSDGVLF